VADPGLLLPVRALTRGMEDRPVDADYRTFESTSFRSMKEWIYFCVEFDLEICRGCHCRARKKAVSASGYREPFHCADCRPAMHPDLWQAITTQSNVTTRCASCDRSVAVKECWISDDCQRLYCAEHVKPLEVESRYRMARQHPQRWRTPPTPRAKGQEDLRKLTRVARSLGGRERRLRNSSPEHS